MANFFYKAISILCFKNKTVNYNHNAARRYKQKNKYKSLNMNFKKYIPF